MNAATERVSYVRADDLLADPVPPPRAPVGGLGRRRHVTGALVALLGLPLLTLLLAHARDALSLESQVLLYLLAVVIIAVIGGLAVALASAVAAAFLINYFFVKPEHTLEVAQGEQALALAVFLIVAAVVSWAVEAAARRARAAESAAQQAETLSVLARSDFEEHDSLHERARTRARQLRYGVGDAQRPAAPVGRAGSTWTTRAGLRPARRRRFGSTSRSGRSSGWSAAARRCSRRTSACCGHSPMPPGTAYEGQRLSERAGEARELAAADRQRTALLAAVGHDLRTPLAGIKASVSTLRQTDVEWSDEQRRELLAAIEESADRLGAVVENLLDASRLEAGALTVQPVPVALDEVIAGALLAVPGARERDRRRA